MKAAAERLNIRELQELGGYIHKLLEAWEATEDQPMPARAGTKVLEERRAGVVYISTTTGAVIRAVSAQNGKAMTILVFILVGKWANC